MCCAGLRKLVCLGGVAMLLAGCRLDMHVQPKYLPYEPSNFFDDGRSERPVVPGTVARGQLHTDELLYTGKENGVVSDKFPFPMTRADLERGRERYNIYCTPCHDYTGSGQGMIVQRGFPPPPSFHLDSMRRAPAGHFFEVITNGFGSMYSYASRVEPEDRWRIAAYIRALQLSQHATMQDVPESDRANLTRGSSNAQGHGGRAAIMNDLEQFQPRLDRMQRGASHVGGLPLALLALWFARSSRLHRRTFQSYLFSYVFWFSIPLGCYGDFDDAPFNRRLVGLSDQATFGSGDQNDPGYDGLVHPDIVRNK